LEYIEFGKIVNTHALKGEIKVYSYTDNIENILSLNNVYINNKKYTVSSARFLKGMFTMKLKEVNSIEDAEILVGNIIYRELKLAELDVEDEYFVKDLEGIEVYDEQNTYVGILEEVFTTGANDVYKVVDCKGKDIYLPAIKQVVKSVDIKSRKMIVNIMEGLRWNLLC